GPEPEPSPTVRIPVATPSRLGPLILRRWRSGNPLDCALPRTVLNEHGGRSSLMHVGLSGGVSPNNLGNHARGHLSREDAASRPKSRCARPAPDARPVASGAVLSPRPRAGSRGVSVVGPGR